MKDRGTRLDTLLTRSGIGPRGKIRKLIRSGRVCVSGDVVSDIGQRVPESSEITIDDEPVAIPPSSITLLMHKPTGYACSHDVREAPTVYDLLPPELDRLSIEAIGRLDRETTGLLLFTTDGGLNHRLTHPKRKVARRYRVVYTGTLADDAVERVRAGITLSPDEPPTRPAELALDGDGRATLVLTEGRFHQVRRMIGRLGGEVTALHRDRIGTLDLPADLPPGAVREATDDEMTAAGTGA